LGGTCRLWGGVDDRVMVFCVVGWDAISRQPQSPQDNCLDILTPAVDKALVKYPAIDQSSSKIEIIV
jgi:hypothetical protein